MKQHCLNKFILLSIVCFLLTSWSKPLPILFMIGDSISIQYGPYLEAFLKDAVQFERKKDDGQAEKNLDIPTGANGGDSRMVLEYLRIKLRDPDFKADYMLLNCGLHDIKRNPATREIQITEAEYSENLNTIFQLLLQRNIQLIWIRTTPVVDSIHNAKQISFHRFADDVSAYNKIADEICEKYNVPAIDLHSFSQQLGVEQFIDHVHFSEYARAMQGEYIAGFVKRCIASSKWSVGAEMMDRDVDSFYKLSNPVVGRVRPRSSNEISGSLLSIGAETMDRDFTIYDNWKSYLGPLGFKKARILSGWMKTETAPGNYEWAWMDNIIHDMVRQGVTPWVTLCYGNPLYTTFKDDSRGDPPRTEEAWLAWEAYVAAFVERYKDKVNEYEIWNEPRPGKKISPEDYATLVIRTTTVIKSFQPEALINILALDHTLFQASVGTVEARPEIAMYAATVLDILKREDILGKVHAVTYHPYTWNPDDAYESVIKFRKFVQGYHPGLKIIQGENGAPSEFNTKRALNNYSWTERSQAKYGLRRIIGDLGHNVPTSYFSIADMFYDDEVNSKALLKARPDKTIERPKKAYFSLQNVSSIFDEHITPVTEPQITAGGQRQISAYLFKNNTGNPIAALWISDNIPDDYTDFIMTEITMKEVGFNNPVYVDMLTGEVRTIESGQIIQKDGVVKFTGMLIPDYPVLIAEKSLLEIISE